MDLDGDGRSSNFSPVGNHLLLIGSFVDNSLPQSRYLSVPGGIALRGAFNFFSKYAGALLFRSASLSNSDVHNESFGNSKSKKTRNCQSCMPGKCFAFFKDGFTGLHFSCGPSAEYAMPLLFSKLASTMLRRLRKEIEQIQSFPFLSLTAALVPPRNKLSPKTLGIQQKRSDLQINGQMDQLACVSKLQVYGDCYFPEMNWVGHASEAATGIEFPTTLNISVAGDNNSSLTPEILVGTGSRSLRIMRIKTLRVYAFGLYVQPASICQKLGPKYASIPISELNSQPDFFEDLLSTQGSRFMLGLGKVDVGKPYPQFYWTYLSYLCTGEDIDMTVRLVVNFNGLKVSTVRDTFERSLRTRLSKVNPQADYHCLRTFTSYFTEDTSLPVGTTIDFRQTAKGQLITEIGGKQIGTVHSKDLCRAFFDMYIGDVSVAVQSKEEITRNVASIIRRC